MIKTIIISNNTKEIYQLKNMFVLSPFKLSIIKICKTNDEAINSINSLKPDLIILDTLVAKESGYNVLEKTIYRNYKTIITSINNKQALIAFKYNVLNYLVYPINNNEVIESIKRFNTRCCIVNTYEYSNTSNLCKKNNQEQFLY